MEMPEFSRRQFLKVGSLLFAGTGVALLSEQARAHGKFPGLELAEEHEGEVVAGTIARIDPSGMVYVQSLEKTVPVTFTQETFFSRGKQGVVNSVNDYILGDKVVAEGVWEGDAFRAHTFMSIYQLIEGTVTARTVERLETTGGTLLLIPETKPARGYAYDEKPLSEITVGDGIGALAWQAPGASDYFALRIGVAEGYTREGHAPQ
jgi:hypothetical protein